MAVVGARSQQQRPAQRAPATKSAASKHARGWRSSATRRRQPCNRRLPGGECVLRVGRAARLTRRLLLLLRRGCSLCQPRPCLPAVVACRLVVREAPAAPGLVSVLPDVCAVPRVRIQAADRLPLAGRTFLQNPWPLGATSCPAGASIDIGELVECDQSGLRPVWGRYV